MRSWDDRNQRFSVDRTVSVNGGSEKLVEPGLAPLGEPGEQPGAD